jgi:Cys-tRNA(Pro)/Cys-tRNA(Cys) deacylase
MVKNNVTRFLSAKKADFETLESEPIKRSALENAALFGLDPAIVYKSIICFNPAHEKYLICLVPGPYEVNPKKLAQVLGEKKVFVTSQKEAEKITGLEAGGISPFALIHKGFQMLAHNTLNNQEKIAISGGQRGLTILIKATDLIRILNPKIADIADEHSGSEDLV